ncbi:unnamed protein product [Withania somnifera]
MELKEHQQPHAVLIPLPLQGHINPFTHLASKGFTITFVGTQSTDQQIAKPHSWKVSLVFQAHVDDFIENLVLSKLNPPISCIIADSFHVWGSMIAKKYNLFIVSFWTEPTTLLTVFYHTNLLKSNGHFGRHGMNPIS